MSELELEKFIQSHTNWRELLQQPPYNMDYREYLFSCVKQPDKIVKALGLGEKNE